MMKRLAVHTAPGRRSLARAVERVLWGGERRERVLIALLRRHYESVFRRQWRHAREMPHYFDHRIGSFAFAIGSGHPYTYFRGFFTAEMIREGDVLLDIGCGDGFFARRFYAPKCAHVDAIDIERSAISHASRRNPMPNIAYAVLDAVTQPFPRSQYDVIVLDGALGHFAPEPSRILLTKISEALTEDGVFVGSESLGLEGHDHLQHFSTLTELGELLGNRFPHVQARSIDYVIPSGDGRREAFWRCAFQRTRLDEAAWTEWKNAEASAPTETLGSKA
jgi:SAM-dependent methyltransferase